MSGIMCFPHPPNEAQATAKLRVGDEITDNFGNVWKYVKVVKTSSYVPKIGDPVYQEITASSGGENTGVTGDFSESAANRFAGIGMSNFSTTKVFGFVLVEGTLKTARQTIAQLGGTAPTSSRPFTPCSNSAASAIGAEVKGADDGMVVIDASSVDSRMTVLEATSTGAAACNITDARIRRAA